MKRWQGVMAVILVICWLATTTAQAEAAQSAYTTSDLNLRTGPSTGYRIVLTMPEGSPLQLTGSTSGPWQQVRYGGYLGWAHGNWIAIGQPEASPASNQGPIIDLITEAAWRYGQSPAAMIAVARCESELNPKAYNRSSGASGLFQFLPSTWRSTPYANYSIFNAWASANAAAWMWSVGRRGEWVC
jgi:hypothetical protein